VPALAGPVGIAHRRRLTRSFPSCSRCRAYGRIGTSYQAKDDLDSAIKFFNKSLTEHRTPEILEKLRLVEKTKKERDVAAYIDPAKAEEAREAGNDLFRKGDFVGAVRNYSEAIKRLPCVLRLTRLGPSSSLS
jgi:tetratricopeptide (TPR) repeat protein